MSMRVAKLERRNGADDVERWLNSLSDDELDARIAAIDERLRTALAAEGIDCTGMTSKDLADVVGEFEANGGNRPARFEREPS